MCRADWLGFLVSLNSQVVFTIVRSHMFLFFVRKEMFKAKCPIQSSVLLVLDSRQLNLGECSVGFGFKTIVDGGIPVCSFLFIQLLLTKP